jgi:hypothetical protein
MAYRAVHVLTAQHEFHGLADQLRRQDAEDLRPGEKAFRAEAAAEVRAANMDLVRRDAEQPGDSSLRHRKALARRIDRQRVAVPRHDDRMRLHGIVILRRRLVGRIDPL